MDGSKHVAGIVTERRPTDVFWCGVFVVFLLAMVGICGFSVVKGDIQRLIAPQDASRRFCGIDEAVKDKKNVYWTMSLPLDTFGADETARAIYSSAVCVKECPKQNK